MSRSPYRARYWRHFAQDEEECDSLGEAIGFLAWGEEGGELAPEDIVDADGNTVLSGDELSARIVERLS